MGEGRGRQTGVTGWLPVAGAPSGSMVLVDEARVLAALASSVTEQSSYLFTKAEEVSKSGSSINEV